MKSKLLATAPARPAKPQPLKLEPVDGLLFVDRGLGGTPAQDALAKYREHWERHPNRLRKGQKGAAELMKEARDRR